MVDLLNVFELSKGREALYILDDHIRIDNQEYLSEEENKQVGDVPGFLDCICKTDSNLFHIEVVDLLSVCIHVQLTDPLADVVLTVEQGLLIMLILVVQVV